MPWYIKDLFGEYQEVATMYGTNLMLRQCNKSDAAKHDTYEDAMMTVQLCEEYQGDFDIVFEDTTGMELASPDEPEGFLATVFPEYAAENKSNKQFEEFAKKWNYDLSTDEEGFYMNSLTQRLWDCWEESRRVAPLCDAQ